MGNRTMAKKLIIELTAAKIIERFDESDKISNEILVQAKITNGRVTALEDEMAKVKRWTLIGFVRKYTWQSILGIILLTYVVSTKNYKLLLSFIPGI